MRTVFFLACGFVVARGQTGPAAKTFRGAELRHIRTDFRDDGDGAAAVNARDGTEKGNISLVLLNHDVNTGVHPANESINIV